MSHSKEKITFCNSFFDLLMIVAFSGEYSEKGFVFMESFMNSEQVVLNGCISYFCVTKWNEENNISFKMLQSKMNSLKVISFFFLYFLTKTYFSF